MKRSCLSLALLLLLGACQRVPTDDDLGRKPGEPQSTPELAPSNSLTATLIQRIVSARRSVAFQGVRRVELHADDGAVAHQLVLRERVSADGQGGFAIEALDVLEPQLRGSEREVFLSLQSLRQGLHWRYRDFTIHDESLFAQNYRMINSGATVTVAGIPNLLELRVERLDQTGSIYTLAVEASSGLVLSSREMTPTGQLVSEMRFESLQKVFDAQSVVWHQSLNNEQELPTSGDIAEFAGFPTRAPRVLPLGYQLLERSSILHPQGKGTWVKSTYSDGVDTAFFLHGGPIQDGNGIQSGAPVIQADLVEVALAAPWTVTTGNLRGERVMALGKLPEHDLLRMLSSAVE
jgi:hypothetical protein